MIKGIGVDIVKIERISITDNFINKVLSNDEIKIFKTLKSVSRQKEFLAGRFAAKEAYFKALKTGIGPIALKDISILNGISGEPVINQSNTHISISHEKEYAIAYVVIEE